MRSPQNLAEQATAAQGRPVWLVVLAVVALLLLVLNIALNVGSYYQQQSHSRAAARASRAMAAYEKLFSEVSDAESGQRGYLLTGDESHLRRYEVALRQIVSQADSLEQIAGPEAPVEDLRQLEDLVRVRLEELGRIIASFDEEGLEAARAQLRDNFQRNTMDRLRQSVDAMVNQQQQLHATRVRFAEQLERTSLLSSVIAGALTLGTFTTLFYFLRQHFKARNAAIRAVARQARLLQLGAEVGAALTLPGEDHEILTRCAQSLVANLDIEVARIWLVDQQKKELQLAGEARETLVDGLAALTIDPPELTELLAHGEVQVTGELASHPRVPSADRMASEGFSMYVLFPLKVDEEILGGVDLFSQSPLSEVALPVVASVASKMALAVRRRQSDAQQRQGLIYAETIVDSVPLPLLVLDGDLKVATVNQGYCRHFQTTTDQVAGRGLFELEEGLWDIPTLRTALEVVLAGGASIEELEIEGDWSRQGRRILQLSARRLLRPGQRDPHVLVVISDVTQREQAARAMRHSERQLRAIYDGTSVYIGMLAPDGTMLEANRASLTFADSRREELVGRPFWECVWFQYTPGAPERVKRWVQLAARGEFVRVEAEFVRPSGEPKVFEVSLSPVFDDDGQVAFIVPEAHDITSRKRGEDATARLAAIVDASKDAIVSVDVDRRITSWNRGAEQMFGYPAVEAVGQPISMLIPPEREGDDERMMARLLEGVAIDHFETVRLRKDGTRVDVSLSVAPLRDRQGEITGVSKIARDITEHKRAIERLQESEERLRSAVDVAQLGTVTLDFQAGTATPDTTAAQMFGLKPHEPISTHLLRSRFYPIDDTQLGRLLCETIELGEEALSLEHRVLLPDGTIRWLNVQQRNFFAESESGYRPLRGILAAIDITQRKQFEESLQQARDAAEAANRSRGEFLANMSHEIRTPMTAILGHADILSEHLHDPDNVQAVETIRRNGRFLLEIVNDILDLSKIDAGRMVIEKERIRPELLMADIRSLMAVRARDGKLQLSFEFEGPLPATIETDAVRLRQILLNLIGNAIKFTDEGSVKVTVRYLGESNQLEFAIADTGIGIAPEDMPRLFESFTQADASNTREHGGTGLGLAISRRLARALGGDIWVQSELGVGSEFRVTVDCGNTKGVPLVTPQSLPTEAPEPQHLDVPIDGHILIVDDRRDIRFLAQHFIEKAGGTVAFATNGQEAIELLLGGEEPAAPVDLVLLDMQMPVMDGYRAAEVLRDQGFEKPIIALTAYAMKEDRDKCLAAGCNDYLAKPLDADELVRMIDHHLPREAPRRQPTEATP